MSASPTDPLALWTRRRRAVAIAGLAVVVAVAGLAALPLIGRSSPEPSLRASVGAAVAAARGLASDPAELTTDAAAGVRPAPPLNLEAFAIDLWRDPAAPPAVQPEPPRVAAAPRVQPPTITLVALLDVESDRPRVAVTVPESPRVRLLAVGETVSGVLVVGIDGAGIDVEHRGQSFRLDLPRRTRSWPAALERIVRQ